MKTQTKPNREIIVESILQGTLDFMIPFAIFILITTLILRQDIFSFIWNTIRPELTNHEGTATYYVLLCIIPMFILSLICLWLVKILKQYALRSKAYKK